MFDLVYNFESRTNATALLENLADDTQLYVTKCSTISL